MSKDNGFKNLLALTDKLIRKELGSYYIITESRMNNYIKCLKDGAKEISVLKTQLAEREDTINKITVKFGRTIRNQSMELEELHRQMDAVWNFVKPNSSNDMNWCDEIIIAIQQRIEESKR